MKKVIALLLSVVLAMTLMACGSNNDTPAPAAPAQTETSTTTTTTTTTTEDTTPAATGDQVKLVFSVNEQPQLPLSFWQGIADRYMAANPDVIIEILPQPPGEELYVFQQTLLATGQFPDVMIMQNAPDFAAVGALLPFSDDELWFMNDVNIGKIGGVQYTAVNKFQVMGWFYNKGIFADNGIDVPKTYDQFIDNCRILEANGVNPIVFSAMTGWTHMFLGNEVVGTDLLAKDPNWGIKRNKNEVHFENDTLIDAFTKYQYIAQNFTGDYLTTLGSWEEVMAVFFAGEAAMHNMGSWFNGVIKGMIDSGELAIDIGWFPMPGDTNNNVVNAFLQEGYAISATTKHPEVAKDFVTFLFTDVETYTYFLASEQLFNPTNLPITYDMTPLRVEMGKFVENAHIVEGFESMSGDNAFLPGLKDYYTGIFTQEIALGRDVREALKDLDNEWEIANNLLR